MQQGRPVMRPMGGSTSNSVSHPRSTFPWSSSPLASACSPMNSSRRCERAGGGKACGGGGGGGDIGNYKSVYLLLPVGISHSQCPMLR